MRWDNRGTSSTPPAQKRRREVRKRRKRLVMKEVLNGREHDTIKTPKIH